MFASNDSFLSYCKILCSSRGLIFQDAPALPLMNVNICLLNPSDLKVLAQLCSPLPTCSCCAFGQLFTVADAESWFLQEFNTCVSGVLPLHSIPEELLPLKMNWIKPCQEHWSCWDGSPGVPSVTCVSMRQWPLLDLHVVLLPARRWAGGRGRDSWVYAVCHHTKRTKELVLKPSLSGAWGRTAWLVWMQEHVSLCGGECNACTDCCVLSHGRWCLHQPPPPEDFWACPAECRLHANKANDGKEYSWVLLRERDNGRKNVTRDMP